MKKEKILILVDTNIIIDFWRKPDIHLRKVFEDKDIAICGIIHAELLHGARSEKEVVFINNAMDELIFLEVERDDWIEIGKYLNKLKKNGVTVPFQDVVIAFIAVKYDARLWTNDQHFKKFQSVIKQLKFFQL